MARTDLCVAASPGGHLELLLALDDAYRDRSRLFVVPAGPQADALRARGERVEEVVNPWRSPVLLARAATRAASIVRRERPRIVLSSGAGLAVPVCVAGKALGAKLVFCETMARVESGSLSGRLLHRLSDAFLVQWPELLAVYPRAELCRPPLLEAAGSDPAPPGEGTLVVTGSHGQPFDRLLRLADDAVGAGVLPGPALAQAGPSGYAARHMETVSMLPRDEIEAAVRRSAVVVAHGGAGFISLALRHGRRPLVLSRLKAHGEHLDDHQLATTRKLAELGYVVSLDAVAVESAVPLAAAAVEPPDALPGRPMAERLRELLDAALLPQSAAR